MSDELAGAREVQSNWWKPENVGDFVKGVFLGKELRSGTEGFADQWIYQIRDVNSEVWNAGIAVTKQGTVARASRWKVGQLVGIHFEKEGEAPKKGFHPSKHLKILEFDPDPRYEVDELAGAEEVAPPTDAPKLEPEVAPATETPIPPM